MENKEKNGWRYTLCSFLLVLLAWKLLTLHFSPLVVPTISSVASALVSIVTSRTLLEMIRMTTMRLIIGLTAGVGLGLVAGILMGNFRHVRGLLMPVIGLLQTVPPVSWVVLALVWFGFNGKPAVFIVVTATLPIIAIHVSEGIRNVDRRLLQMAEVYRFSGKKKFVHIIFPSILPYFSSAFRVALGSGWKIAVMGEVLTTSDGIGGMIKLARLNVEPENIIAWSVVIVALFYASDFLLDRLFFHRNTHRNIHQNVHRNVPRKGEMPC